MVEEGRLSSLIGDIYDASLDPDLWAGVMASTAAFVGGAGASLSSKDATRRTLDVVYNHGTDPRWVELYRDEYVRLDPMTTGQFFATLEQPISTVDLIDYDEFLQTRFYQEWARPQGLVDCLCTVLDRNETHYCLFAVFRHERDGLADEPARRRLGLLAPHVRRAMLIGRVLDFQRAEAASLADALDGLAAGMFLLDAEGRVVHANASGHSMLAARDVLNATGGRLAAADARTDASLQEILLASHSPDDAIGRRALALPVTSRGGNRHVAHLLPLSSGARRRAGARYQATAALFVHEASRPARSAPETIARAYGLTPTELRVLMAIVEVGGGTAVAVSLGVAPSTVKTHLARLYEKTGARRHADLVRLAAGFADPLAP